MTQGLHAHGSVVVSSLELSEASPMRLGANVSGPAEVPREPYLTARQKYGLALAKSFKL